MATPKPTIDQIPLPFPEKEFADKWAEWIQYRRERRLATYVPTGLKRTFTKLVNDSGNNVKTAILIIEQAMGCNWQGLHPLKQNFNERYKGFTQKPNPTGTITPGGFGNL